jgi:hypothetical protein
MCQLLNDRTTRLFDSFNDQIEPSWDHIVLGQSPPDGVFPLTYRLRREPHVPLPMCHDQHFDGDKDFGIYPMKIVIRCCSITAKISQKAISSSVELSKK